MVTFLARSSAASALARSLASARAVTCALRSDKLAGLRDGGVCLVEQFLGGVLSELVPNFA
jgi:hypothetical protein